MGKKSFPVFILTAFRPFSQVVILCYALNDDFQTKHNNNDNNNNILYA